ncbi:M protein repeat protein, partial [Ancylostoma duodenale]
EIASLKSQIAEARKRFDEELEQHVADLQRKAARDLTEALNRAEEADAAREKAERAKLKAQQEVLAIYKADDATREVTEIASVLREYERKQRKIDQQFAEEKANTSKAISERDAAQQQARDAETRYLNAVKESKELQDQIEVMEKERRMLRLEVDNLIVELEDALQMADDAKTRGEVMLQAAKQDWERQLSQRSEEEEDQKRSLNKRLRELEEEIGIEQRLRTQTLQSKKKLEAQFQTLQEDMEHLAKQNEEANRQIRRVNMIVKEAETEGAEARAAMDEALCKARDFEKRLRTAEAEVSRLSGDLSTVQAARRKVEAERDDLAEELSNIRQGGLIGQDEKKRYEKRIADLQEMVEEEQTSNELVNEKLKKAQAQVEQLTSELTMERSMCERADADKATLERALRDLKVQLQDAEGNAAARARTQIATAEAKAQMLEQQLQNEEQEKNRICRQFCVLPLLFSVVFNVYLRGEI